MSSKRRLRRHVCGHKERHQTELEASREAGRLERLHDHPFEVYGCANCGGWHVAGAEKHMQYPHGSKYAPAVGR